MDTEAVNSAGNPTVPPPKKQANSSSSEPKAVPSYRPNKSEDSVDLSNRAKALSKVKSDEVSSSNNKQRKFSLTDGNKVVIELIDPQTQEVVKSIPTEEEIQLKNAIRDGIKDINK